MDIPIECSLDPLYPCTTVKLPNEKVFIFNIIMNCLSDYTKFTQHTHTPHTHILKCKFVKFVFFATNK